MEVLGWKCVNLIFLTNKTIAENKRAEARGGCVPFGFSPSVSIGVSFLLRSATRETERLQPLQTTAPEPQGRDKMQRHSWSAGRCCLCALRKLTVKYWLLVNMCY